MPVIGDIAPDFALPNQDGKIIRLSDYRGKKVILFAYPAANTMGCTMQACAFRDALPRFDNARAVILGISPDDQAAQKKFKDGQKLPYDLLSDPEHTVLDAWEAWGRKILGLFALQRTSRSVWVMDEAGRVIDMQVGILPGASVEKALKAVEGVNA